MEAALCLRVVDTFFVAFYRQANRHNLSFPQP